MEGAQKQLFPNLKELVTRFEKPDQGLVVPLLKPIRKPSPYLRWRRQKIQLEGRYGKHPPTRFGKEP